MRLVLPQKPLFRPDEVADLCDVTKQTVYRWIEEGHLYAVRLPGQTYRVPYHALLTLLTKKQ